MRSSAHVVAQGLGWFSIALGMTELLATRTLTRTLGMDGQEGLVRAYGAREIATGIAILASSDPTPWIWGRVAGDALDLATLATGLDEDNPERRNLAFAIGTVAAVTALDVACGVALSAEDEPEAPMRDYSNRSGFSRSPAQMRGAARDTVEIPRDMRAPEALRPWTS